MNKRVIVVISMSFIVTLACATLMPAHATREEQPAVTPPAPDTPAPTSTPLPTVTPVPTNTLEPTVTPTLIVLPQQWSGSYTQAGVGKLGISIIIDDINGDLFFGKMIWAGTAKFRGATTKINGEFIKDFGNAEEQAKWANHPDYKKGERDGVWIKWTEDGFIKGSGYTLGGWYYGHIENANTMTGIYYLNAQISSFASSDSWTLVRK